MGWVYRSTSANTGCEGFVRSPTKRTFARFLPYMSPELLNCRVFGVPIGSVTAVRLLG